MGTQVITIRGDGSIAGLQHKPGRGVDLKGFGRASIKRASEVLFSEEAQAWYVEFRSAGVYSGRELSVSLLREIDPDDTLRIVGFDEGTGRVYFGEYDDAVAGEIAFLNHARLTDASSLDKTQQG